MLELPYLGSMLFVVVVVDGWYVSVVMSLVAQLAKMSKIAAKKVNTMAAILRPPQKGTNPYVYLRMAAGRACSCAIGLIYSSVNTVMRCSGYRCDVLDPPLHLSSIEVQMSGLLFMLDQEIHTTFTTPVQDVLVQLSWGVLQLKPQLDLVEC